MGAAATAIRAFALATACACEAGDQLEHVQTPDLELIDGLVALHAADTEPTTLKTDGGYQAGTSACSLMLMLWLQDNTATWDAIQSNPWWPPSRPQDEGNEDCVWLTAGPPYHARDQPD